MIVSLIVDEVLRYVWVLSIGGIGSLIPAGLVGTVAVLGTLLRRHRPLPASEPARAERPELSAAA